MYTINLIVLAVTCFAISEARRFNNPVLDNSDYPDPGVILVDGVYYAVTTTNNHEPEKLPIFRSTDLQFWEQIGFVFTAENLPPWSGRDLEFWAPEIHRVGNDYRIYFTSRDFASNRLSIGVATAPNPTGPWRSLDRPLLLDPNMDVLDSTLVNDNGNLFLFWKGAQWIYGRPLNPDGLSFSSDQVTEILINDRPWEGAIVEAPFYVRRNQYHYLFYSGNHYCGEVYSVGIARSLNPLGPYEKRGDPILTSNDVFKGTGHCSIVKDILTPDDAIVFHAFRAGQVCSFEPNGERNRLMMSASVGWGADDWPFVFDF